MGKILTPHGVKRELAETFGVCHVTVSRALNDKLSTRIAIRIRVAALAKGGVEVEPVIQTKK